MTLSTAFIHECKDNMLTLQLTDDYAIEKEIFGDITIGEHVALMDERQPVGVCVFNYENDKIIIRRLAILQSHRGKHFGDFFIRSILFKFSLSNIDIAVPFIEPKLVKFGFIQKEFNMLAKGGEIVFPSSCANHNV